jgi:hypothetical protein
MLTCYVCTVLTLFSHPVNHGNGNSCSGGVPFSDVLHPVEKISVVSVIHHISEQKVSNVQLHTG